MKTESNGRVNKIEQKSDSREDVQKPSVKNETKKTADGKEVTQHLEEIYRTLHRHSLAS